MGLPYDREIRAMSDLRLAQELARWEPGSVPHQILSLEWVRRRRPWHSTTLAKFVIPIVVGVLVVVFLAWLGLKP